MDYIYTWLASGVLHMLLGGSLSYLFHGRIASVVSMVARLFDAARGAAK